MRKPRWVKSGVGIDRPDLEGACGASAGPRWARSNVGAVAPSQEMPDAGEDGPVCAKLWSAGEGFECKRSEAESGGAEQGPQFG